MLEKYRRVVQALPIPVQRAAARELGLPWYAGALYEQLDAAGFYQADLVLALLRANTPEALAGAEALVGHPIRRLPPGARALPRRGGLHEGIDHVLDIIGRVPSADLRRFIWLNENVQLPTTDSFQRFRMLKVGMTVGSYVARGGWRRDVREWEQAGKIRLG
jgi:hypothetical protein